MVLETQTPMAPALSPYTEQLLRDRIDVLARERLDQLVAEQVAKAMKKDPDKGVRIFVVHALGNALGPTLRDFVKDLAEQLPKEAEGDVRLAIVQELGALGPDAKEALPALQRAVADVQITVRDAAKQAVKKVQGRH